MARINISVALHPDTMKLIEDSEIKGSLSQFIDETVVMRLSDEKFQEKMALKKFAKAKHNLEMFGYVVNINN